MSPHESDDLNRLLTDAVSDIEPRSAIEEIRSRTRKEANTMASPRNWMFGAFGAAVATAAVITAVVMVGNNDPNADRNEDPAVTSTPSNSITELPSEDPTTTTTPPTSTKAVPVYYVGETPQGLRLYREFQRYQEAGDAITASADLAVSGKPLDPDYRSLWPDGARATASYNGDFITVNLESADAGGPELGLHDLPPGMTDKEAGLAIEQVIYSVQGALGQGRPGVQFMLDGSRTDQILGQPASEPLANGPVLETLALVNITTPGEGEVVSGDTLKVTGVANSFEANVLVRLQRYEGTFIVDQQPFTAEGWMENKLFPFSGTLDISAASPGKYILMAQTDDPSGGAEGNGPHTDTKIITIE